MDHTLTDRLHRAQRIQEEAHWRIFSALTPSWNPPNVPSTLQTIRHDYLPDSPYELMDWYWCAETWGRDLVAFAMRSFPAPKNQRIGVDGRRPGTFDFGSNPAPLLLATGHYEPNGPFKRPTGVDDTFPDVGPIRWLHTETEESFQQSLDAIGYVPAEVCV